MPHGNIIDIPLCIYTYTYLASPSNQCQQHGWRVDNFALTIEHTCEPGKSIGVKLTWTSQSWREAWIITTPWTNTERDDFLTYKQGNGNPVQYIWFKYLLNEHTQEDKHDE